MYGLSRIVHSADYENLPLGTRYFVREGSNVLNVLGILPRGGNSQEILDKVQWSETVVKIIYGKGIVDIGHFYDGSNWKGYPIYERTATSKERYESVKGKKEDGDVVKPASQPLPQDFMNDWK